MSKRFSLFILLFCCFLGLQAQDTITVMQYNLLQYGNYNSGFADCYETNNNTQRKDECIRILMDYVKPDILTVCEFGATQSILNGFLQHNLNINGINYWKSDNIINYANSNIINHIFYDSRKMELKKRVALRTNPRDTDVYELYMKTPGLIAGDTTKLICIVAHPKAGLNYEGNRRATMQVALDYVHQYYASDNVLIMGDFNMYGASESGYRLLTSTYTDPDSRFVDPLASLGGVGEWNNNYIYAPFHTQSTRGYSEECFSGGGLDDRFDFILMSDEIYMGYNKMKYVNNSFFAVGNDGYHFNQSIDQNGNSAVPDVVAEALFDASDHLPVTMKMRLFEPLGVEEHNTAGIRVYPNPTDGVIVVETFHETSPQQETSLPEYRITNILGQVVMTGPLNAVETFHETSLQRQRIDISKIPAGIYFIHIGGNTQKIVKR